ncbi:MAG: hypothetical protein KC506_02505 [Nanoarchaeota archaeon]|nr:hypothetical protein [Nanoarchaeota archaeon]
MAEKDQILKEELEHSGLFDFKGIYSFLHSWLIESNHDVDEEKYGEKTSGNSRDIDIQWKAQKKMSDYFKAEYKIVFEIKNMTEVEVEIDGKKKNMNKGIIKIKITGTLVMDHSGKWESTPFSRFTRDVYNKFVIPSRISAVSGTISNTVVQLKENAKAFMELSAKR